MEEVLMIIAIIAIALVIGYFVYTITCKRDFTSNAKIIIRQLFIENNSIEQKLNDEKTSQQDVEKLKIRKQEILNTLSQFYGYDLKHELV